MNNQFQEIPIGDLLVDGGYIRGPFGSSLKRGELKAEGVPVYEQQHAIYKSRDFRFFIDATKHHELRRFTVRTGDLIISCSGTVGKISLIKEGDPNGIISQALLILRPNQEIILSDYLYYVLSSPFGFHALTSVSSGSVQVNIAKRSIVENVKIKVPPIYKQIKIISTLKAIDDMIELNNKSNETLELIANTIFKEWFIDFGPVKTKAEGKKPLGLSDKVVAYLPDSFEDSDMGLIPKGWKCTYLKEVCNLEYGKALKEENRVAGAVDVWGSNAIVGYHNINFVEGPGIVVGRKGNAGAVNWAFNNFWPIDTSFYVVPKPNYTLEFIYHLLLSLNLKNSNSDSAVPGLNRESALSKKIIIPSDPYLIKKFTDCHMNIFSQIKHSIEETEVLSKLKDLLLPKLISGEIEQKD